MSVQLRAPRDSRAYEGAGVNQQMLSGLAAELGRVSRPDPGGVRCLVLPVGPRDESVCLFLDDWTPVLCATLLKGDTALV